MLLGHKHMGVSRRESVGVNGKCWGSEVLGRTRERLLSSGAAWQLSACHGGIAGDVVL